MRCSAWRDLATHCAQSLAKGMRVIAQGQVCSSVPIRRRTVPTARSSNCRWTKSDQRLRYATAQVQKMQSGGYQGGNANGGGYQQQPQQAQQQSQGADPWAAPAEPEF